MKKQFVIYWENYVYWYFKNNFHRDRDLPAVYYFIDEKLYVISYYQHNKFHRTTGPAFIDYKDKIKEYYYQGKEYDSLEEIKMVEACR